MPIRDASPSPPKTSGWRRLARELGDCLLLLCSTRIVVEGESMAPVLRPGDRLLVNRLAYRLRPPRRGEIVLLRDPDRTGFECIKRITGLPGDRDVRRKAEGVRQSDEPQAMAHAQRAVDISPHAARTPPGHYFVQGDNRAASRDSRDFGPVHRSAIIGPAWRRYARNP